MKWRYWKRLKGEGTSRIFMRCYGAHWGGEEFWWLEWEKAKVTFRVLVILSHATELALITQGTINCFFHVQSVCSRSGMGQVALIHPGVLSQSEGIEPSSVSHRAD